MEEKLTDYIKEEHHDTSYRCHCGCTIKTPHSHLVYGQSCECEKGEQELSLTDITSSPHK